MNTSAWQLALMPRSLARLSAVMAILTIGACSDDDAAGGRDSDAPPATATTPAVPAAPTVPADIEGLGHHAENAFDMTKAGDWAKAKASTDSLEQAVAGGQNARSAPTYGAMMVELRRAVTTRQRRAAMIAANRLTELGARLSEPFGPAVPADVTLLDYYGRELEIWAASGDLGKLRETADAVGKTWDRLQAQVEQRGGSAEAARFGDLVKRVRQSRTPREFGALATPILDEVDKLEVVFQR